MILETFSTLGFEHKKIVRSRDLVGLVLPLPQRVLCPLELAYRQVQQYCTGTILI